MFIACKSSYCHKNRQYLRYLQIFFFFFKGVSIVIDQPVSPEKDHFNLKLSILISVFRFFWITYFQNCYCLLCKTVSQFFTVFLELPFIAFKSSGRSKIMRKIVLWTIFWHYCWTEQILYLIQNLKYDSVSTYQLFQTSPLPSICCWWLSRYTTSKSS